MTRYLRMIIVVLVAIVAFAHAPAAQVAHPATPARAGGKAVRDLALAAPDSVGVSADRLKRLDAAMKRLVDEKQVAGLVTLLERHGKVVSFTASGQLDVRKSDALQKDSIFRIYSMTKPVTGVAMMMLHEEGKWRL